MNKKQILYAVIGFSLLIFKIIHGTCGFGRD